MSTSTPRVLAAGAVCALGLGALSAPTAATAAPVAVDSATTAVVSLLHFNDFHGRIDATTTVQFAGTVEQLRADYPDSTVLLSGGDSIGASSFVSASQQDAPTLEVLNAMGLDASAVGNHEFDRGVDDLTGRVDGLADFPYLSANVTRNGEPIGPAYTTVEVDGITVGVIGAVTEEVPQLVDRAGIEGVAFGDPVEAVNRVAAQLSDGDAANGEADVLVAEIHDGSALTLEPNAPQSEQTAVLGPDAADSSGVFGHIVQGLSADVDVIFNGHTHRTYSWLAPVPGVEGATRPVVQSNEYSNLIGQVVLTVDRATGEVTAVPEQLLNHARSTDDPATLAATYPRVAAVKAIVDEAVAQAAIVGNEEVGTISGPISVPLDSNSNRGEESTMAQLVADMYRDQLSSEERGGAQIGVVNPGGVRDSLDYAATAPETSDGVVRLAEANAVLPFVNNLWTGTLTGTQLDQLLEEQWQRDETGAPITSGRTYLQLGLSDNVTYVSDPSRPIDDRVSQIAIDGDFITPEQEIRVASSSFLFGPGDNFWTMGEASAQRDSGLVDQDAFLVYLAENPGIGPDWSVRHVDVTSLPSEPVAAGSDVTVEVEQIDRIRSIGAEASATLEVVDASGAVVGSADVVVNTDDAGAPLTTSATVTFTATTARTDGSTALETFTLRTPASGDAAAAADGSVTVIPFQLEVIASTSTTTPTPTPTPSETAAPSPSPSAPSAPEPTATAPGAADGGGSDDGALPQTGATVSPWLWGGALALVLIGGGLVLAGRLRRLL